MKERRRGKSSASCFNGRSAKVERRVKLMKTRRGLRAAALVMFIIAIVAVLLECTGNQNISPYDLFASRLGLGDRAALWLFNAFIILMLLLVLLSFCFGVKEQRAIRENETAEERGRRIRRTLRIVAVLMLVCGLVFLCAVCAASMMGVSFMGSLSTRTLQWIFTAFAAAAVLLFVLGLVLFRGGKESK
jgi:polyferredoxin